MTAQNLDDIEITPDSIQAILVEHGYEVTMQGDSLRVYDLDSGIVIHSVLVENILFNSVSLITVDDSRISLDLARLMLDSSNGITTSSFQLYKDGKTTVTLNNFCKLQGLGPEDIDDILSCLQFLEIDAYAARELLSGLIN